MVLRKYLTSWCQMSTWKRTWTLSLTELVAHRDLAGTRSERGPQKGVLPGHIWPGRAARQTLALTRFLVQRRKTFKELTKPVAWGGARDVG
jgi:hypothetical protein